MYEHAFESLKIGGVTIKNRICQGPVSLPQAGCRGELTEDGIAFLLERAKGGFGLVFQTAVWSDMQVEGAANMMLCPLKNPVLFKKKAVNLTERVHTYGAKIFAQITMGIGRNAPGAPTPSPIPNYYNPSVITRELTVDEIHKKIEDMVRTAVVLKDCGYDGVEVHAMHWGYLIDEFAMALTNHRTDEYGGSLENRVRVCKEIVEGIKAACGKDFPVTIKMGLKSFVKGFNQPSLTGEGEAGRTIEEAVEIAKLLESYGYDALHCNAGIYDSFFKALPPMYAPKGEILALTEQVKKAVNIPVLANSRMNDPDLIENAIASGKCDAAVLSRGGIAEPYFARKMEMGQPKAIRPCLSCTVGCTGRGNQGKEPSCAVNPVAGKEHTLKLTPALERKRVLVVGGGVAGMEAALTAKLRGHEVFLYEKSNVLGGHLLHAGAHEFKRDVMDLRDWFVRRLDELHVPVTLGVEVTADIVKKLHPDTVILSVGSYAVMPRSIPGIGNANCISCVDAIEGKRPLGEHCVIVGGGLTGCELAYDLVLHGKQVEIVEMLDDILLSGPAVPFPNAQMLHLLLEHYNVKLHCGCKLDSITDEGAVIEDKSGVKSTVKADDVIIAIGLRPNKSIAAELRGCGMEVYEIGDGRQVANIQCSVWGGYEVARGI